MENTIFNEYKTKKVIVRSMNAGVFYGTLAETTDDGYSVKLEKARKIWYWDGAAAVEGLAVSGVSKPDNCKFTATVDSIGIVGVCQILPCTEDAVKSIEAVKDWVA